LDTHAEEFAGLLEEPGEEAPTPMDVEAPAVERAEK